MAVDLDEMFAALGRHADEIPLAPAGAARRRGRQRTRTRALVAAAAVCLVAVGVGVTVNHHRHLNRPDTPVATSGALPEVGSPLDFGGPVTDAIAAIAGGRVFTAWSAADGRTRLAASDLHTGAVLWSVRAPAAPGETFNHLQALPQAVVLTLARPDGDDGYTKYAFDPQDGRLRWKLAIGAGDDVVIHSTGLVRASAGTGRTEAVDWVTGRQRWSVPAGADRPVLTRGMYVPGDDDRAGAAELPTGFTDDRLVQVTATGKVQVRDATTGELRRTVTAAAPDPDYGVHTYAAYDGMLYNSERAGADTRGYRIRVTDLRTDQGGSRVVLSEGAGHRMSGLVPCGPQRLCVADSATDGRTTLAAIDAATGRRLWQATAPDNSGPVGALHGRTLVSSGQETVLLGSDGAQLFHTSYASVGWFDAELLLIYPAAVAGSVAVLTTANRRITALGDVPAATGGCTWTAERLACPTGTSLRIWSLTR